MSIIGFPVYMQKLCLC